MTKARDIADLSSISARLDTVGGSEGALSNRNIIINGAMAVAQRGTSGTSGPDGTGETYLTVDRWKNALRTSAVATVSQSTDTPSGQGFINSFKLDCTTADTSVASNDYWIFQQRIEKQNVLHLAYGTSSAKSTTISFWVKSTKTGTYICELGDAVNDRFNRGAYTVDTADTWEKKTITFVGDTGGGLGTSSLNGAAIDLNFWLMSGSDFSGGSAISGWTATGGGRANGQVNFFDSTSNDWYITGVQLEVGDTETPFEYRSYDDELSRCQRYFQAWGAVQGFASGVWFNSTQVLAHMPYIKEMRAAPTFTTSGNNFAKVYKSGGTIQVNDSTPFDIINTTSTRVNVGFGSAGTSGEGAYVQTESGAYIHVDAEL